MKQSAISNKKSAVNSNVKKPSLLSGNNYKIILIIVSVLTTFIVFSNSLNNDFTNYDDELYIINNNYIKDFSAHGITEMFKAFTKDELPMTLLSFAVNFKMSGLNPHPYHTFNLLLHLINVLLVFLLIFKISKKVKISFITSLLFGIHPFRVESVSWVTERKDVLYTFFFLLSLISYISYINSNYKLKHILIALILFILSILSKFAALTLPAILILLDYFYGRKLSSKLIIEKVIFFIIPLLAGIIHFYNKQIVEINEQLVQNFPLIDRIFMGSYSLLYYIMSALLPFNMTLIHPYPVKINGMLPMEYYISLVIAVILIITTVYFLIKHLNKNVILGVLFFLITISIVLHIIPIGGNIIVGERYTYLAYIGLFFIIAYFIDKLTELKSMIKYKNYVYVTLGIYVLMLCSMTFERNKVWQNSITLWTDVISKNQSIYFAYNKRADANIKLSNYQDAADDLTKSVALFPTFAETYNMRGTAKAFLKDYKNSLDDYNNAIRLNPNYIEAYKNRGLTRLYLNDMKGSVDDYSFVLNTNPNNFEVYNLRGYAKCLMNDVSNGIADFDKAISLNPSYAQTYSNRGNARAVIKDFNGSIDDFSKAIEMNPKDASSYANRGNSKLNLKNVDGACIDWQTAVQLGYEPANDLIKQYCTKK